jgi:hypothetical protein
MVHRFPGARGVAATAARARAVRASAAICALLAFAAAVPLTRAARPVPVYEAAVRAGDTSAAYAEAMREVLVRATGLRDAGTDPALAGLVTHAAQYVRSSRALGDGTLQIEFDGPSIERQIVAAGRNVWDAERPFTIIVLSPPPTGPADDAALQSVEAVAEVRGLPVTLVPMAVTDSDGHPLTGDALLTNAERLGGEAVLLGRADPAAPAGSWQWTLLTGFSTQSWNGTLEDGVNGAADALAKLQGSSLPLAEEDAAVEVTGITTLADYAEVERMLSDLPGVRRSGLVQADGATATFSVLIRGGARAIERSLAGSQRLGRAGSSEAPLTYQFHP